MPAQRAGYTVTMFLVDVSASMGAEREVEVPDASAPDGVRVVRMTNLEWVLQFVKLKIQEMIFNGRKTDQCGVLIYGTEETDNIVNDEHGGYEHITEYIPIAQPNANTLAKLSALQPSTTHGDPMDAIIVGIETQDRYLAKKKSWIRKMIIVTDGASPIEVEDWVQTVGKMDELNIDLVVVGVDFDDEEFPYKEENKSDIKRHNEEFFHELAGALKSGIVGTCALALQETARPDIRQVNSALTGNVLRLGDVATRPEQALELLVKTSKCTSKATAKGLKKFARAGEVDANMEEDAGERWAQLKMRTEYYVSPEGEEREEKAKVGEEEEEEKNQEKVEKEQLVKGFKYGSTYVPCPDGEFSKLDTKKGIDICGFFHRKNFRRELALGEVYYVWADPATGAQQLMLSAIVQAMFEKDVLAIARWVGRDGAEPRMGVLKPCVFEQVDCFLWAPMPFADDVRKYTFASLEHLVNKNGKEITKHPYLPTDEQQQAMDAFVDSMDLMSAGDKDEEGNREPWFDTRLSYNPAIHRRKHALFHSAVVDDLATHPLPPPHPELTKYFSPPRRVLKRAREPLAACKSAFRVREVPKRVARPRKDGHVRAQADDGETLLLDAVSPGEGGLSQSREQSQSRSTYRPQQSQAHAALEARSTARTQVASQKQQEQLSDGSVTEDDSDNESVLDKKGKGKAPPASRSPTEVGDAEMEVEGEAQYPTETSVGQRIPLNEFMAYVSEGQTKKAVEGLADAIYEIVAESNASKRRGEMIECLTALRAACLEHHEIDLWNEFLPKLKVVCLKQSPGNTVFWDQVKKMGRKGSLISDREAEKTGGESLISEAGAVRFLQN